MDGPEGGVSGLGWAFRHTDVEKSCTGTKLIDDGEGLCNGEIGLHGGVCSTNGFKFEGEDGGAGDEVGTGFVGGGIMGAGKNEIVEGWSGGGWGGHFEGFACRGGDERVAEGV